MKAWYEANKDEPEEAVVEELEYLTEAFSMIKPDNKDKAQRYLKVLEDAYVMTDYKVKELFDRVYEVKQT
ncbi:hypothetical protein [Sulfuracidifex tepidarius]|uniref:hypothetical protein n=1 Tax=Sulfuracidifex tepidarius TaxID=1294262 RepID=UPI0006CF2D5C|nr:hypothetical protein [Sulfuracidifex tepidarius]